MQLDNRIWGGLALRGALAILFGVLALSRPGATGTGLIYLFGAYAFIDGIFALVASVRLAQINERWWPMLLVGLAGLAAGVFAYGYPLATAVGIVYFISAWAIVTGFFEVIAAFRLRRVIEGEWMLAVAGLLSIAFGLMIGARPEAGLLSLIWVIGAYAIIFGVLLIGLAVRLRGVEKRLATP
jgi:uncharacterized membrane protein HdeD (DUF308 family)